MATNPQPWSDASVRQYERDFLAFSIQHGIYCVPIDDEELNRQAEFYDIISRIFERRLFLPGDLAPEFVLDCGSGSGIEWPEEVMEKSELGSRSSGSGSDDFPCQVVAVDIFHTQGASPGVVKKRWNLNEAFRRDQDELARDKYDLVNSRFLADGINKDRWPSYVQDLHHRLRRGGWLQMVEAQFNIQSSSGRPLQHLPTWWGIYSQALERQNKDPRAGTQLARHMRNAGFVNVVEEPRVLPVGDWHPEPHLREIGRDMRSIAVQTLRSLSVWPCRAGGMDQNAFDALIAGCEREMADPTMRLYVQLYAVWGRRATQDGPKQIDDRQPLYIPNPKKPPLPPVDWA